MSAADGGLQAYLGSFSRLAEDAAKPDRGARHEFGTVVPTILGGMLGGPRGRNGPLGECCFSLRSLK